MTTDKYIELRIAQGRTAAQAAAEVEALRRLVTPVRQTPGSPLS